MSVVEVRASIPSDLVTIRTGMETQAELDRRCQQASHPDAASFLERTAGTMTIDGEPVALEGWEQRWDGVYHVWTIYDQRALQYPKALYKYTLFGLRTLERDYGAKRIEAQVDPDSEVAMRWIRRLGFRFEGRCVNANLHGEGDLLLYARTTEAW